jgi:hypothetical protein
VLLHRKLARAEETGSRQLAQELQALQPELEYKG